MLSDKQSMFINKYKAKLEEKVEKTSLEDGKLIYQMRLQAVVAIICVHNSFNKKDIDEYLARLFNETYVELDDSNDLGIEV
jgi:hypothetical protein